MAHRRVVHELAYHEFSNTNISKRSYFIDEKQLRLQIIYIRRSRLSSIEIRANRTVFLLAMQSIGIILWHSVTFAFFRTRTPNNTDVACWVRQIGGLFRECTKLPFACQATILPAPARRPDRHDSEVTVLPGHATSLTLLSRRRSNPHRDKWLTKRERERHGTTKPDEITHQNGI